jgi:hypothetical protein
MVCGSGFFRPVAVPRPGGRHYTTCFHECAGCSIMFVDPLAFSANEAGPPHSRGPQLPPETYQPDMVTYGRGSGRPVG